MELSIFELTHPGGLKLKTTGSGDDVALLDADVPKGKKWSVVIVVDITEEDV